MLLKSLHLKRDYANSLESKVWTKSGRLIWKNDFFLLRTPQVQADFKKTDFQRNRTIEDMIYHDRFFKSLKGLLTLRFLKSL